MKINKIILPSIAFLMLMISACDPIVESKSLGNTTDVEGVELIATQTTNGGNNIILEMATPGVTGYWDYNLGRAFTDKVQFIYPIPGTATFTFTGTLGAEFFTKTIDVQIDVLDNALDQDWYDLVGEDTSAGKTWVFAGTGPDTGDMFWYMSPPNDPNAWATAWWNAGGTCCPPGDVSGKMHFDLDGAANYTYYNNADAAGALGSFVLDVTNQTLQFNGQNVLGAEDPRGNPDGLYQIISLTEDEMILYVPNNAGGTGWTWIFKPQV